MIATISSTFNVSASIDTFKASLTKDTEALADFDHQKIAVAIPVYDPHLRNIALFDTALYQTQKSDAEAFCDFLNTHTTATTVELITKHADVAYLKDTDYLIMLNEFIDFTDSEEENLIKELQTNGNAHLKVYKLY